MKQEVYTGRINMYWTLMSRQVSKYPFGAVPHHRDTKHKMSMRVVQYCRLEFSYLVSLIGAKVMPVKQVEENSGRRPRGSRSTDSYFGLVE